MSELPRTLKHLTVWLVLLTALVLGFKAWQSQAQAARLTVLADGTIELVRSPDGHFHWPGTVNGRPVDFLVDTGATRSALPAALAQGLASEGSVRSLTAGGEVEGHLVRADIVLEGGVEARGWRLTVLPQLGSPLLGMDVLGRLQFSQTGGVLRLRADQAR